eukprot:TRINITY_DN2521_c0_g1_i1.p2 TRINITY_DN2521_c0_g1~~TRINITY_DN2521_c0_g1_i1.p2  ORF type:complete len:116 (-),score=5.29 TRINITY_DN2521_c0_g1_i1:1-348(-)
MFEALSNVPSLKYLTIRAKEIQDIQPLAQPSEKIVSLQLRIGNLQGSLSSILRSLPNLTSLYLITDGNGEDSDDGSCGNWGLVGPCPNLEFLHYDSIWDCRYDSYPNLVHYGHAS